MDTSSTTFRAAHLAALLLAAAFLSSCGRPPDEVLKEGFAASAQMEIARQNPFAAMAEVKLRDYKVTNDYKRGDAFIYEYEGTVLIKGGFGNPNPSGLERPIKGKVLVRKEGNQWRSSPMMYGLE